MNHKLSAGWNSWVEAHNAFCEQADSAAATEQAMRRVAISICMRGSRKVWNTWVALAAERARLAEEKAQTDAEKKAAREAAAKESEALKKAMEEERSKALEKARAALFSMHTPTHTTTNSTHAYLPQPTHSLSRCA